MEIIFCYDREMTTQDARIVSALLGSSAPKLEGYFIHKGFVNYDGSIEAEDVIEYKISECPGWPSLSMAEKMDKVRSVLNKLPGSVAWIHLYFGYGNSSKFLGWIYTEPKYWVELSE